MPVSVGYVDMWIKEKPPRKGVLERGLLFRWPDRAGALSHE